ncbi:MAG: protein kinase [Kofleriaceae bacterium]
MIGQTIGNFRVISRLGRGGMGEVFLGEHVSIQTRVAIKVMHPSVSSETDQVQRFFNEARVVARIRHAGVVKIFDVGFHDDSAYLVMELLEGELLSDRIARRPLSVAEISDFGRQIASTLAATHSAGVIHRDLKPENIYVIVDEDLPGRERIKVLDFGVAKLSGTLAGANPKTIGLFGTPCYMAPEQFGDASKVDWRADAYSLGCVVFEMACGQPPFDVKTVADAYVQHTQSPAPAASTIAPHVSPALDALIARLLAKQPALRPGSMREIAEAFQALIDAPSARMAMDPRARRSQSISEQSTTLQLGAAEVRGRLGRRLLYGSGVAALAVGAVLAIGMGSHWLEANSLAAPAAQPIQAAAPPPAPSVGHDPAVASNTIATPEPAAVAPTALAPTLVEPTTSLATDAGVVAPVIELPGDAGAAVGTEPAVDPDRAAADTIDRPTPALEPKQTPDKPERSKTARRPAKRTPPRKPKSVSKRTERTDRTDRVEQDQPRPGPEADPGDILDDRE